MFVFSGLGINPGFSSNSKAKQGFLTWLLGRITWRTFRNFKATPQNLWRQGQASVLCCGFVCLLSPPADSNVQPRSTAGHSPCDLIYPHGLVDCKRMTPNLLPIYPDFSARCLLEISTWVSYRHLSHVKNEINNGFPPTILLLLNHSHFPTSSFFPLPRRAK